MSHTNLHKADKKNTLRKLIGTLKEAVGTVLQPVNHRQQCPIKDTTLSCSCCCELFSPLACELIKLYYSHYILLEHINKVEALFEASLPETRNQLEQLRHELENTSASILKMIEGLVGRQIIVHHIKPGDTLWKISRHYTSDMNEIYSLNHIQNILTLRRGSTLLVPVRYPPEDISS